MSYFEKIGMYASDSPSIDAFDRLRVSTPYTIFDSKQLHDNAELFWDQVTTDGGGSPSATHSTTDAATTMTVNASGDTIVRQTFMRFNYQPGKSQMVLLTTRMTDTANVKARVGLFSGDATSTAPSGSDGIFFEADGGSLYVVIRKNGSDTRVEQSSWNVDSMDGTGPSGVTIDPTKVQILFIDFEWLGVGRVRMGFVVDGIIRYCHQFNHANISTAVYMSTPNLPLRYEISSSGGSSSLVHICTSVLSEGGLDNNGTLRSITTNASDIHADTVGTIYACLGIRLKSTHLDATVIPESISMLCSTADDFEWRWILNPTVAGTFTYTDLEESCIQYARVTGDGSSNTVTGGSGYVVGAGVVAGTNQGGAVESALHSPLRLGSKIDGTVDELVLCAIPLSVNSRIFAAINWRELL